MNREVDEKIREAFEPHPDSVERVVEDALASTRERGHRRRAAVLGLVTVAALALGVALHTTLRGPEDDLGQPPVRTEDDTGAKRWVIVSNSVPEERGQILMLYGGDR